jgi:hypothetical protein
VEKLTPGFSGWLGGNGVFCRDIGLLRLRTMEIMRGLKRYKCKALQVDFQ